MIPTLLMRLLDSDELLCVTHLSMPKAVRVTLKRMPLIHWISDAIGNGTLPEDCVRQFVNGLLLEFQPGQHFPHDYVLAAIAVALESQHTSFSEEYLHDLAGLKNPELSVSRRVARECLMNQSSPTSTFDQFSVGSLRIEIPFQFDAPIHPLSVQQLEAV